MSQKMWWKEVERDTKGRFLTRVRRGREECCKKVTLINTDMKGEWPLSRQVTQTPSRYSPIHCKLVGKKKGKRELDLS